MRTIDPKPTRWLTPIALVFALSACAQGGASPPSAPKLSELPQVVYRIDDHRYFELTPDETCFDNMLYFVDTAKGIRSEVVKFDAVMNRTTLIIDAANDQYLVAPVTRGGNTSCSSGGGACGSDKMPYSTDGGRTWRLAWSPGNTYDLMATGLTAYQSHRKGTITQGLDLTLSKPQSDDWKYLDDSFVFKPRIAPADTKVMCRARGNGSLK